METIEFGFLSLLFKILTALVGMALIFFMGKTYDRKHKVKTNEAFDLVEKDARAFAQYSGFRLLAFAVVVAWILA